MIPNNSRMLSMENSVFCETDVHSYGSQLRVVYNQVILSLPITNSKESFIVLRKIWDAELIAIQEQVYILFLNANSQLIAYRCLHTGTTSQSMFDIKLALACALGCLAKKIIIAHNHPSGNLRPSTGDILITEQLNDACELMDIDLKDHLIISANDYYSFKDNSLVF